MKLILTLSLICTLFCSVEMLQCFNCIGAECGTNQTLVTCPDSLNKACLTATVTIPGPINTTQTIKVCSPISNCGGPLNSEATVGPEVRSQVLLPAIAFHQHRTILQSNQLWDVDPMSQCSPSHNSNLRQSVHSGLSEALLDEAEAAVVGKLDVACDQEVKVQTVVELVHGL
ncbi:hypothetical protein J4Q44_G00096300 [Coregonus suidteri]|uniref:Uncharacterized protein n=1 Tax=Coregonus suidteri TaxID=861788 RepID=A0AAN8R2E2_9TELE